MMTIGSLCAGACDGLSLGLEWAGLGPTIWQVEKEDDRRANLSRHWPDADRSVTDVTDRAALALPRPDVIVCSSPCQDLSSAGKRAGLAGARSGVWFACERIIGALGAPFVVVENVASGARNWVPYVRSGLARFGYTTLPIPLSAADCGAPHLRRRVFVLAHAAHESRDAVASERQVACVSENVGDSSEEQPQARCGRILDRGCSPGTTGTHDARSHFGWPTELEVVPPVHGVSGRMVSWLGDSVVPQCAEVVGWVIRELAGLVPEGRAVRERGYWR